MSSEKRSANALGGKTARPCDSCLCKRARWYCAADDAFLCQACDASVHSANQLARRHERLSLKTSAGSPLLPEPLPPWLRGFSRKARTPRHSKPKSSPAAGAEQPQIPLLVPDLSSGDDSSPPDEEQLLYRVPIFDPVSDSALPAAGPLAVSNRQESKPSIPAFVRDACLDFDTCDADLAADMESLLGKDLDSDSFCMDALGLTDAGEGEMEMEWRVKTEEVDDTALDTTRHVECELDLSCDTLDLKFGYESPTTAMNCEDEEVVEKKKICLRLNYESVITEWATQGSPWMNGDRPSVNPDDCWPDWTGLEPQQLYQMGGVGGQMMDRGREARVSRYREKRRSRLFSKKIRYEVRKLNAEKRPRMKGRFVKRASLAGPPAAVGAAGFGF
ncbi:hypothetical protein MRB53_008394 [Persea americana]|uniref:Uncharacterized protein n=1 Tax=Persea americana TaxID=3435 RepID=A0ACC2MLK4_PERAE|nr:hypothetical protein MRB53_008394 [Persea americana]